MNKKSANSKMQSIKLINRQPIKKTHPNMMSILCIIGFVVWLLLAYGAENLDNMQARNQYITDAFVSEGQIIMTTTDLENGPAKYYAKLKLVDPSFTDAVINEDQSWIEINQDFYQKHHTNDLIGVLVGNYDIFKEKYFGWFGKNGQTFEKNVWGFENVFDTKQAAEEAYPHKTFTANGQIKEKTTTKDGQSIFVINYDNREITMSPEKDQFAKYNTNDTVVCDIESVGDFIKINSVH